MSYYCTISDDNMDAFTSTADMDAFFTYPIFQDSPTQHSDEHWFYPDENADFIISATPMPPRFGCHSYQSAD